MRENSHEPIIPKEEWLEVKEKLSNLTVRVINAPEQAQEMATRYIRALYGVSLLEFARQMEKAL